jgi:hypothetical protein
MVMDISPPINSGHRKRKLLVVDILKSSGGRNPPNNIYLPSTLKVTASGFFPQSLPVYLPFNRRYGFPFQMYLYFVNIIIGHNEKQEGRKNMNALATRAGKDIKEMAAILAAYPAPDKWTPEMKAQAVQFAALLDTAQR